MRKEIQEIGGDNGLGLARGWNNTHFCKIKYTTTLVDACPDLSGLSHWLSHCV